MNGIVKYDFQRWIIYHQHVIHYTIVNYIITIRLDDGNGGKNTELHNKVLLQVSVYELHI